VNSESDNRPVSGGEGGGGKAASHVDMRFAHNVRGMARNAQAVCSSVRSVSKIIQRTLWLIGIGWGSTIEVAEIIAFPSDPVN